MKRYYILLLLLLLFCPIEAKRVFDIGAKSVFSLFKAGKAKYVIRKHHQFSDTLYIPSGSELFFDGGQLDGPISFDDTKLSGNVNLKGSTISGTLRNKVFNAAWLCEMDGKADDAPRINQIIDVCGNIFFPKGSYRLISEYDVKDRVPRGLTSSIMTHIAIGKSNVSLKGEKGTKFITDKPLSAVCVFSPPNQIGHSIKNIEIESITFDVYNDGLSFHEFVHTIKLIGVNGISIKNCLFNDFWGDAICLSHYGDNPQTGERTRNQNVKILNNIIIGGKHHNNRNGISVVSGKNVLIKGNIIKNTSRKDMPGGVDVEPNNSAYTIENVRIEKNYFDGIGGTAGAIGVVLLRDNAPAYHVVIQSNVIYNSQHGISIAILTNGSSERFFIKDNIIASDTHPYNFVGSGSSRDWVISGNTFEKPCSQVIPGNIKVERLIVNNNKKKR